MTSKGHDGVSFKPTLEEWSSSAEAGVGRVCRSLTQRIVAFAAIAALAGCVVPPDHADEGPDAPSLSVAKREACLADGGSVERRGILQAEMCVRSYADAGKVCTDGSQCEGICMVEGQAGTPGTSAQGMCQKDDKLFGCFGVVTDGRIETGLCVD